MNHVDRQKQKGFTLIELMLAMAFVALLLLAVAMTVIQIANIYNRGLMSKDLNQTSRHINDDINKSFQASSGFSVIPSDNRLVTTQWGGRMCLGQYSYIWNYAKATGSNRILFTDGAPVGFVRVPDSGSVYCTPVQGRYPAIATTDVVNLIDTGERSLALHDFKIATSATATDSASSQTLYTMSYVVGTSIISALNTTQTACLPPNNPLADPNYCAVQQFALAVRVVDGVN